MVGILSSSWELRPKLRLRLRLSLRLEDDIDIVDAGGTSRRPKRVWREWFWMEIILRLLLLLLPLPALALALALTSVVVDLLPESKEGQRCH